jgi:hypothetical protein
MFSAQMQLIWYGLSHATVIANPSPTFWVRVQRNFDGLLLQTIGAYVREVDRSNPEVFGVTRETGCL